MQSPPRDMTFFWRNQSNGGAGDHSVGLPTTNGKRHLPLPRGPHSVGFIDLMTPGGLNSQLMMNDRGILLTTFASLCLKNSCNLRTTF